MIHHRRTAGITLLEIMLVLAIAMSLLMLGLRLYNQFQYELKIFKIRHTVDQLFQAMYMYHQANCRKGSLSPVNSKFQTPISVYDNNQPTADFAPYLTMVGTLSENSFVQNYNGQFNLVNDPNNKPSRSVYACWNTASGVTCGAPSTIPTAGKLTIVFWIAQVAVELNDPTLASMVKAVLNADCVSDDLNTCDPTATEGKYVIFQQIPSQASQNMPHRLGLASYYQILNIMQQHDPFYEYNTTTPISTDPLYNSYYLCGG